MGCYEAVEKRRLGLFKGMAIGAAVALVAALVVALEKVKDWMQLGTEALANVAEM